VQAQHHTRSAAPVTARPAFGEELVQAVVDEILSEGVPGVAPREIEFCQRVFAPPLERYSARLGALGFTGRERVLDAAAGFGQWTLVMAGMNLKVDACDLSEGRVGFMQSLVERLGADNIQVAKSPLTQLPYPDGAFDAVFCYGAVFCTDWRGTLCEFHRVLAPGGRLYMTANGLGYQLFLWMEEPNKSEHLNPRSSVPISLQNTLDYQLHGKAPTYGQIVIEPEEMTSALAEMGFERIASDSEGCLDFSGGLHPPRRFFPGVYQGLTCCYEVLAFKG